MFTLYIHTDEQVKFREFIFKLLHGAYGIVIILIFVLDLLVRYKKRGVEDLFSIFTENIHDFTFIICVLYCIFNFCYVLLSHSILMFYNNYHRKLSSLYILNGFMFIGLFVTSILVMTEFGTIAQYDVIGRVYDLTLLSPICIFLCIYIFKVMIKAILKYCHETKSNMKIE
jgi:hypothetical protein